MNAFQNVFLVGFATGFVTCIMAVGVFYLFKRLQEKGQEES